MNRLSIQDLSLLLCCPPCPSSIASKLAFIPPQEPTYDFHGDDAVGYTIALSDRAECHFTDQEKRHVEGFYANTRRRNRIACIFIRTSPSARFTILYSHGNAIDLGQMSAYFMYLGINTNCNVLGYDYSGYGLSTGKPSEKNLYADIEAAYASLSTRYGINQIDIILYGQSIGTVPTVDLATRNKVAGVILHSALMSGLRIAFPDIKRTWFFDAFSCIDKVHKIKSPTLTIHGTDDEIVDVIHGIRIFEKCKHAVEPLWVDGAGHNDVEFYPIYLERLRRFVFIELGGGPQESCSYRTYSDTKPSRSHTKHSDTKIPLTASSSAMIINDVPPI